MRSHAGPRVVLVTAAAGAAATVALAAELTAASLLIDSLHDDGLAILVTAVVIGLDLAAVVAGWTALVLHARGHRRWLAFSAAALLAGPAAVAVLLVLPSLTPLSAGGEAAGRLPQALWYLVWLTGPLILLLPVAVARLVPSGPEPAPGGRRWYVLAGLVWAAAVFAGAWLLPSWLRL